MLEVDAEAAEEWAVRDRRAKRARRNEEMRGGNSPPPKFKEDNLFSDGDSRPIKRQIYKTKEEADNWGWGEPEEKISDLFAQINNCSFDPEARQRRQREDLNPYDRTVDVPSSISDSEDGDEGEGEEYSYLQEDGAEGSSEVQPNPTRGECILGSAACLQKLTEHDVMDFDDENEWLIIKVPKKMRNKSFMVDYCDGDAEDEFHWLEGPHHQEHTTVKDLLERRRSMSRVNRSRQGRTEFRDNDNLDRRDIHGNVLAARPERTKQAADPFPKKKKSLNELLKEWDREREEQGSSPKRESPMRHREDGNDDSDDEEVTSTKKRKGGIERSDTVRKDKEEDDDEGSSLMVNGRK